MKWGINSEIQKPVKRILFSLVLFSIGASSLDSTVPDEVGRINPYANTGKTSSLPYFEKYITEVYFGKYKTLNDFHFENFIVHDLTHGICESLPRNIELQQSILERTLIGEGSHRRLSTTIRLTTQSEFVLDLGTHFSEVVVVIIEKLPSGVFADPFELQHLRQNGAFKEAVVLGETNLELPSFLSNKSLVEVHMNIDSSIPRLSNGLDIKIELPLHARYQPLKEDGYSTVELSASYPFILCVTKDKLHKHSCLLAFRDTSSGQIIDVVWSIPSGIKAHGGVVSFVTFMFAIMSALVIVIMSIFFSDNEVNKKLKQF